jgi:hypothetical protein
MHDIMTKPHFGVRSNKEPDEDISDLSGNYHGETLMHSERDGFYRRGEKVNDANKTVTLDQAMRLFLHGWQDEAGLFDAMRSALDRAGVEPLKL